MDIIYKVAIRLFLIIFILLYNYQQISRYKVEDIKIESEKIINNIKIVHISDFHSNGLINLDRLILEIKSFDSDYIFLTGDMISRQDKFFNETLNFLKKLSKINSNIYYVLGNHEMENPNREVYIKNVKKLGIKILDKTTIENGNISISGINFYHDDKEYWKLIKNLDKNKFNILLTHSPSRIPKIKGNKEDLILTGHTHGGQIRLPIIGAIISPGQGFFPKYEKGLYKIENSLLYVNSGLGNSSIPIRLLNPVSITKIELKDL